MLALFVVLIAWTVWMVVVALLFIVQDVARILASHSSGVRTLSR
jgi:hypothetical protein